MSSRQCHISTTLKLHEFLEFIPIHVFHREVSKVSEGVLINIVTIITRYHRLKQSLYRKMANDLSYHCDATNVAKIGPQE
jgi:hypothetical protein